MGSGEKGLGIASLSFEGLHYALDLLSDNGIFVDLGLEMLENSRINH